MKYIAICINTPTSYAEKVRKAMGEAGAGRIGNYSFVSFSIKGTGRCKILKGADPAYGKIGKTESNSEEKIETFCKEKDLPKVIKAIKKTHPYDESAITIYPVEII